MRLFIALAILTLVGCSEKYIVENEISMQEVDELIHKNQHNLDSACRINSMADSMTRLKIASMSMRMKQVNTVMRATERIKIVYVFDTIYIPVIDATEGVTLTKHDNDYR
jgi:hypothetical protein